jgi:hypothetical protein
MKYQKLASNKGLTFLKYQNFENKYAGHLKQASKRIACIAVLKSFS